MEKENDNITRCNKCNENSKLYYHEHKESINRKCKNKREEAKNKNKCRVCLKNGIYKGTKCNVCYERANRTQKKFKKDENYPKKALIYRAKVRAKKLGIEFDLKIENISIPTICPVLGIELNTFGSKMGDDSPSLDRINPMIGYIKSNVSVISQKANRLKSNLTRETLVQILNYMDGHENK